MIRVGAMLVGLSADMLATDLADTSCASVRKTRR
jgi:hypothetical protein